MKGHKVLSLLARIPYNETDVRSYRFKRFKFEVRELRGSRENEAV